MPDIVIKTEDYVQARHFGSDGHGPQVAFEESGADLATARAHIQAQAEWPEGCYWKLQSPADRTEPTVGRQVVEEWLYPGGRGTTGWQAVWERRPVRAGSR